LNIQTFRNLFSGYTELRAQENRVVQISLLRGDAVSNSRVVSGGVSARVYRNGSWGFASAPEPTGDAVVSVIKSATDNAAFLDAKERRGKQALPSRPGSGDKSFHGVRETTQKELMDFIRALDTYIAQKYPELQSRSLSFQQLDIEKNLITSDGADFQSFIPRSIIGCSLSIDRDGAPVSAREVFGGLGTFDRQFTAPDLLFPAIDELYTHLRRKKEGVYADKGARVCVLDADLAGILAHEAIGHTVEADFVLAGSVARNYLNEQVAPPCVTLIDYAHTAEGETCPVPVYVDDEGTYAKDIAVIENGVLKSYLHNRESALHFGVEPTGNGRAYRFSDEPLIRMRNTAFARGTDKLSDMLASVEDGYYLSNPGNGQADATSEFMFAVTRGYEIKNGKLGRALLDTTISGVAFDMLKTVTMVSDDFKWVCAGMCGKKQPIPVGMGGPAIKCTVNIG